MMAAKIGPKKYQLMLQQQHQQKMLKGGHGGSGANANHKFSNTSELQHLTAT